MKYLTDHPEDEKTIQEIAVGRTRVELDLAYQLYLDGEVNSNFTLAVAIGDKAGH